MAYWINESAKVGNGRQISYYLDADSDVANLPTTTTSGVKQGADEVSCLPCGKGSAALSISSGKFYVLNSNNVWTEIGG